jgi:hypothetical protein
MYYAHPLEGATYGWAVEIILKGTLAGFRVVEVPVSCTRVSKSRSAVR